MDKKFLAVTLLSVIASAAATVGGRARQQPPSPNGQPPAAGAAAQDERQPGPSIQFQVPPMPELPNDGLGETDQPLIPGQRWRVRDLNRPKPVDVVPGRHAGDAPSDAIVLFDGTNLSQWTTGAFGARGGPATTAGNVAPATAPAWKVENGYVEVTPGAGSLTSKERFRDVQLHLEFAEPPIPLGASQYRGNSGVIIGGREIQILDNYKNPTYADGYVAAVYNQWPPLVNPSRPPGEWHTLDIAYMAARYEGDRLVRNPVVTVFLNGVMVHDNREIQPAAGRGGGRGAPIAPGADQPITLMGHPSAIAGNAVRYRNIWVRRAEIELPQ